MDAERYMRQITLPGVGPDGQRKLERARVLVVGMGGLGCPSSLYLAAAGVGTLGLADFDMVETSNLHRQILYTAADVGSSKLEKAVLALRAHNPELVVECHPEGITAEHAVDRLSRYDLVLDGTDNFSTRYMINDAAVIARVPLVSASLFQFEAQLAVFDPAVGAPCYRCVFPEPPEQGEIPNCSEAGVFGALPGAVGALQAMEAIKLITGVGDPLRGSLLTLDLLTNRFVKIRIERDRHCPVCGEAPVIRRIEAHRYALSCAGGGDEAIEPADAAVWPDALYLDVREPFEWDRGCLPDAVRIPLGELSDCMDRLPKGRRIVVYCHLGARSLEAVRLLRKAGWPRAVSLAGGMDRWVRERGGAQAGR